MAQRGTLAQQPPQLMLGCCKALFHTKISEPDSSKQLHQVRMVLPGGAFRTQRCFLQGRAQQSPLHPVFPTSSPWLLLKNHLVFSNDLFSHPLKSWLGNTLSYLECQLLLLTGFYSPARSPASSRSVPARDRAPPFAPQHSRHPSLPGGCRARASGRGMTPARLRWCLPEPGSISTSWHAGRHIVPKIGLPHCIVTQTRSASKSNSLGFSKPTAWDFSGSFHPSCRAHRDPKAQSSPGKGWPGAGFPACSPAPAGRGDAVGPTNLPLRKFKFLFLLPA